MSHLAIGARGWRHKHWVGSYYPDDMPEEWWLSYYSNEFSAVLVPLSYFRDAKPATVQGWMDDCTEDFEFFVELDASRSWEEWQGLLAPLGEQLSGIVIEAGSPLVEQARSRAPVFLGVRQEQASSAWVSAATVTEMLKVSPRAERIVYCLNTAQALPAKELREMLESLRGTTESVAIGLFFGGGKPVLENVRQAFILHQLLDWP